MKLGTFLFSLTVLTYSVNWAASGASKKASDFQGDYFFRHSLYMNAENQTVHGIEDRVKVQAVNDKEAQILVETYTHNFHSCQLIGKAEVEGSNLVYKANVDKALNRGRKAQCVLKISLAEKAGTKALKVEDQDDVCKLKFCGMKAELNGEFSEKSETEVEVKDKN